MGYVIAFFVTCLVPMLLLLLYGWKRKLPGRSRVWAVAAVLFIGSVFSGFALYLILFYLHLWPMMFVTIILGLIFLAFSLGASGLATE